MNRFLLTAAVSVAALSVTLAADPPKVPAFERKQLHKIQGHTSDVMCVAFSPDGKLLASASKDKTVRIWDVKSGDRTQRIANQEAAYCVAFSPDGKKVAVGSFGGAINLFEIESGDKVKSFKAENSVALIRWSPDGKVVATVGIEAKVGVVYDIETGKATATLTGHGKNVNNLTFSPDGKLIATASDDSTIRLWDSKTGKERDSLKAHDGAVGGLAFSTDGTTLVTGGVDNTIVRWDVKTGNIRKPVMELPKEANGGFQFVAELPDGKVWGVTWGSGYAVFDTASGKLTARKPSFEGNIISIGKHYRSNSYAMNPDGKVFVAVDETEVYLYDASKSFGPGKKED